MNFIKFPPEYDTVKVIVIVIIIAAAGFFVFKYMQNAPSNEGRVANTGTVSETGQRTPSIPLVATLAATNISRTGATLNGTSPVMDQSNAATMTFSYGTTLAYGSSIAAATSAGATSAPVTGLSCGTLYHYRLTASNKVGKSGGMDKTFRTAPCAGTAR